MHWWIAGITGFLSAIVTFVIWRRRRKAKAKKAIQQRISMQQTVAEAELRRQVRENDLRDRSFGFMPNTEDLVRQAQLRATTPGERPTTAAEAARLSPFYARANLNDLSKDGRYFRLDSKTCFCAICGVAVAMCLKDLHFYHAHPEWKEGAKTLPMMEKEAIEAEKRRRREQRHESLREQVRNMPVEASLVQAWRDEPVTLETWGGQRVEWVTNTVNGVPAEQLSTAESARRAQHMWLEREREEFERRQRQAQLDHRAALMERPGPVGSAERDEAIRQSFMVQTTNELRAIIPGLPPDLPRAENG